MYVSTLRKFIQAMGGRLQIKAIFPEGRVQIDQFENVANLTTLPPSDQKMGAPSYASETRRMEHPFYGSSLAQNTNFPLSCSCRDEPPSLVAKRVAVICPNDEDCTLLPG